MKRFLKIFGNMVFALFVLIILAVLLATSFFGMSFKKILSGSMEPTIHTGDMVIVSKVKASEVKVGDIIVFFVDGMDTPVCHRVIEKTNDGFLTKGDNNDGQDSWTVAPENIQGKELFSVPFAGQITTFVKKPIGYILLLGLPVAALIILIIKDLFKPKRRSAERRQARPSKASNFPAWAICLIGGLVIVGALGSVLTSANLREKTLGSNAVEKKENGEIAYVLKKTVENKGMIPLVICLSSEDKTAEFSKNYFSLVKGKKTTIEIQASSKETVIETGSFLRLLPAGMIGYFFQINPSVVYYIVLAIWLMPITIFATVYLYFSDRSKKRIPKVKLLRERRRLYE